MAAKAQWALLVYLAGDNNLERYGRQDLLEMKRVGSSDQVHLIAQFDRMSDQAARRYRLTGAPNLQDDLVESLPETNTGDPQALLDFLTWGSTAYPSERLALVLWNHGAGWKDDDIYRAVQATGAHGRISRGQVRGLTAGKTSRALFRSSLETLVLESAASPRAILFDDSSADFLDNQELKHVLHAFQEQSGKRIDLLGCDACLMNMVEVAYQVRGACDVMVGSQETEPGDGWSYDLILAQLKQAPEMDARALGKVIVENYLQFYARHYPDLPVTQSAVDLRRLQPTIQATSALGQALAAGLADAAQRRMLLGIVFSALRAAQTFTDRDYLDLQHFCELLAAEAAGSPGVTAEAAAQVVVRLRGADSPLIAAGQHGPNMASASGLSIYLPLRGVSPLYQRLDFAHDTHWDEFLNRFTQQG